MGLIRGALEGEEGKGKEKNDSILDQQLSCTRHLRNARTDARETAQPRIGFKGLCRLSGAIAEGGRQRLLVLTARATSATSFTAARQDEHNTKSTRLFPPTMSYLRRLAAPLHRAWGLGWSVARSR